jgi:hypothetical protein
MSRVKFLSVNLVVADKTDIVAGSEDSQFPASNLKDKRSTKPFRSTLGTDSVVVDFKSIESIDTVAVKAHKLDGFGHGNLTIEFNATDEWTSPAEIYTLIPDSEFGLGYLSFAEISSEISYRFCRITGSGGSYFELSNLFVGKAVSFTNNNIDFGWSYKRKDLSKFRSNDYGQLFFDKINDRMEVRATIKLMNKEELDIFMDVSNYNRRTEPVWVIVDDSETIVNDKERFFEQFYFRSSPTVKNSAFGLYDTSFSLVYEPVLNRRT